MRQNEMEVIANRILGDFGIGTFPFSCIQQICEKEQITMIDADFDSQMDGAFAIIKGEKYLFYNPSMPDGRKNFTKAHELGHYFLGHELASGYISCAPQNILEDGQAALAPMEKEANLFATFFLMPESILRAEFCQIASLFRLDITHPLYIDKQPCNSKYWNLISRHLIACFGVSQTALGYRLDALGLIQYRWNG